MLDTYIHFIFDIGLLGIFIYMIIVGTFIPAPTQIILIPAGILIAKGDLNIISLILTTATGTTIGATINYAISKKYIHKLIPKKKQETIIKIFKHYGDVSVFIAPMMIGLGQYISLIAGLSKMNYLKFILYVWSSNAIFDSSMVLIGYFAGNGSIFPLFLSISCLIFVLIFSYFRLKKINI